MADIKWSAFPTVASPGAGDTLVGLHGGANYQFTGLTIPFSPTVGGTGVANSSGSTITLGGALTTSGAFASTFTMTGATSVTFPTSGTLATTASSVVSITGTANEVLVNGTSGSPVTGTAITLTTPQAIGTTSDVVFNSISGVLGGIFTGNTASNYVASLSPSAGLGSLILSAANSAGNFNGFIKNASLSAQRTWTLPDATGTIALTNSASSGYVLLSPSGNQTITGAYNLIMGAGSMVAPTMLPGNLSLTANTISSTNSNGNINFIPNGSGLFLIGSSTSVSAGAANIIRAITAQSNAIGIQEIDTFFGNSTGSLLLINKSRSTSIGSFVPVQSGDILGDIQYSGDDGTSFVIAGRIRCAVAASVSTGIVPTALTFYTSNTSGGVILGMTLSDAQVLTLANPLPTGSGGTGITSLGTGVATALGQNVTGSGGIVLATSATMVTPTLGAASATSIAFSSTSGIIGTTTNNSAAAGSVGEYVSNLGSSVPLSNDVASDAVSVSLTAGDWDVWGNVNFAPGSVSTVTTFATAWINTVSATDPNDFSELFLSGGAVGNQYGVQYPLAQKRISLSTTTTVYLSGAAQFATNTLSIQGVIYARRVR